MNVHWKRNSIKAGALIVLCFCCVSQHLQCLTHRDAQLAFLKAWLNEWDVLSEKVADPKLPSIQWVKVTSSLDLSVQIQMAIKKNCPMRISAVCWYSTFHLILITDFTLMILRWKCADGCTHPYRRENRSNFGHMIFILFQELFQALMPLETVPPQLPGRWGQWGGEAMMLSLACSPGHSDQNGETPARPPSQIPYSPLRIEGAVIPFWYLK